MLISNLILAINVSWGSCSQDFSLRRASLVFFLPVSVQLQLWKKVWQALQFRNYQIDVVIAASGTQECHAERDL